VVNRHQEASRWAKKGNEKRESRRRQAIHVKRILNRKCVIFLGCLSQAIKSGSSASKTGVGYYYLLRQSGRIYTSLLSEFTTCIEKLDTFLCRARKI
jgi:hypothetical protein